MSSYEYLSPQNNSYNLSRLENLGHECDLGIPRRNVKNLIDVLYINLKFLDKFLSLQTFTSTVCCDVTRKVRYLFHYAAAEFERITSLDDVVSVFYNLEQQIWEAKLEIRAKYSFPEATLPLFFNVATPEFVKRFIDTVVMNLSNLREICNPYSWDPLVPCSSRQQVEGVVKELKLLRSFVCFVSGRCKEPQSKHTFFNCILVVAGHSAMISWLSASFSDHQMDIQLIQSCICKIYIDIQQALKSGWNLNIQTHEHVAIYEAGLVETLEHCLEDLSEIVAFKDQRVILHEILNFLRANLINPPREVLEDFGTAIIDIGLLVCSLYANSEEKVLHFSGKMQSIEKMIYLILRKSFHSNLPKIDGLGSIDIILDHLKELLSLYPHSLSAIKSQLRTIQQQLEHFQKKHDGFGSFVMQVIAKAYEVEHIVDCCINKDVPEWFLVRWTRDIIEDITLLIKGGRGDS